MGAWRKPQYQPLGNGEFDYLATSTKLEGTWIKRVDVNGVKILAYAMAEHVMESNVLVMKTVMIMRKKNSTRTSNTE